MKLSRRDFIAAFGGATFASSLWPLAARAQQAMPVVGFLASQTEGPAAANRVAGFLKGLSESQFVVGQNVAIEYRWADGHYERLRPLADELVRLKVAVIAASTHDAAVAARAATTTIPIVFNTGADPVLTGLVASLNKPGGNATGTSIFSQEMEPKRLGLLHEMVPGATAVGVLMNPHNASTPRQTRDIEDATRELKWRLEIRNVSADADFDAAFDSLVAAGVGALFVSADPFLANRRDKLVGLAARRAMPAMYEWPDFVEAGGLMSYGTSIVDAYRQVGAYTGRVLRGEKPADLPVMRPVKFEFAINLKTAKTLGIEVPATLLARADEVIE
jgi:putative ABC transport system substrate-binding protein